MPDTESVVADLRTHIAETGLPLPAPIHDIAYREWQQAITDLQTGCVFRPVPGWREFTRCWIRERRRKHLPIDVPALAAAMVRSGELIHTAAAHSLAAYHLEVLDLAK